MEKFKSPDELQKANCLCTKCSLRGGNVKETGLCRRCSLRSGCQQVVPGIGPHNAKIMFVADYPTSEDELYGEPIVGRPGILLEQLLSEADIEKQNTYITYAVKCRTPKNRIPQS
jgi:uracil-DNA glycosylase family 4